MGIYYLMSIGKYHLLLEVFWPVYIKEYIKRQSEKQFRFYVLSFEQSAISCLTTLYFLRVLLRVTFLRQRRSLMT